jgi:two-component system, cell cycle sensor histidine kinase and response regulator CckA
MPRKPSSPPPAKRNPRRVDLQLMQVVAQSPVLILITDPKGRIEYVNPKFEERTGYPLEEIQGLTPSILKSGETDPEIYRELWDTILAGRVWRGELHNRAKSGELFWESATIAPLLDDQGRTTHFLAFKEDISARKGAEAALQEANELTFTILGAMNAAIHLVGMDGRVQFVNQGFCDLFGLALAPADLIGASKERILELILPVLQGRERAGQDIERIIQEEKPVLGEEIHLVDGRALLRSFQPLVHLGRHVGRLWLHQDITPLKKAEQALLETTKRESLGLMAGGIAHEFNNLFQAMLGNLELAQAGIDPAGAAARALQRCLAQLQKASALSQNMLEFAGKSPHRVEKVFLNDLVLRTLADLGHGPGPNGVQTQLQEDLPSLGGDPVQIRSILVGLIANAAEAMEGAHQEITVGSTWRELTSQERQEGYWVEPAHRDATIHLWVADRGSGIPEGQLGRVFDPFFTTKSPGRGLGLPVILGIARAHGAGLQVLQLPEGGTRIQLCFRPYLGDEGPDPLRRAGQPPRPSARALLLVDDEDDLRETLAEALTEIYGYQVFQARNGQEAIEVFKAHPDEIVLALLDVVMPRMKGPEAFRAMRALRPDLKGILMSGFSEESGHTLAESGGFEGFLKKPFSLALLSKVLEQSLGSAGTA